MADPVSSTHVVPDVGVIPAHVAMIMDGNGRWAKQRFLPRFAGHKRGVETVRNVTRICIDRGIRYLTLFAFSSENWRRPVEEVSLLRQLFLTALRREAKKLHANGIRLMLAESESPEFDHPASIVYYGVEDIHATYNELSKSGVVFTSPPRRIATVGEIDLWMAFFKDVDDNTLGLMSESPKS